MIDQIPTDLIAELCGAQSATVVESVQQLWSGYGAVLRVMLVSEANETTTVIAKLVRSPVDQDHKYGWSDEFAHKRKLDSYENEIAWYRGPSQLCGEQCRVARFIAAKSDLASEHASSGWLLIMEDLDAAGFRLRRQSVTPKQTTACLKWLANLHATFLVDMEEPNAIHPAGAHRLWPIGTYWHLQTRPHEFQAMQSSTLKENAAKIDAILNAARFQTLVHGDAKLANFCFSPDDRVAAVDFQYVGGGCGIKDVAYFISSCFDDNECEQKEQRLLGIYFDFLKAALDELPVRQLPFELLEQEWRSLYRYAWADFFRFLAGWSPSHWKMHGYSKRMTEEVLAQLNESA